MKRSFSWPLFLAAAAVLSGGTWMLVESRETRIAGTISAVLIAWGFVRFCVVDDSGDPIAAESNERFLAGDDADSLVRNDLWSRGFEVISSPADAERRLQIPLIAVVSRRSASRVS